MEFVLNAGVMVIMLKKIIDRHVGSPYLVTRPNRFFKYSTFSFTALSKPRGASIF
jgi:hypothetical protein